MSRKWHFFICFIKIYATNQNIPANYCIYIYIEDYLINTINILTNNDINIYTSTNLSYNQFSVILLKLEILINQ